MIRKTDIVRQAIKDGDYKKALRIAKDFRLDITRDQRIKMTRAYECMVHPEFYSQLNFNPPYEIEEGKNILASLYGE